MFNAIGKLIGILMLALCLPLPVGAVEPFVLDGDTDRCALFLRLNGPKHVPAECRRAGSAKTRSFIEKAGTSPAGGCQGEVRLDMLHFANDSSQLDSSGRRALRTLASVLAAPESAGLTYRIEGHANRTGSPLYNLRLSQQRAEAVYAILVDKEGIDPAKLSHQGFGYERLYDPYHPTDGINRRVEIVPEQVDAPCADS